MKYCWLQKHCFAPVNPDCVIPNRNGRTGILFCIIIENIQSNTKRTPKQKLLWMQWRVNSLMQGCQTNLTKLTPLSTCRLAAFISSVMALLCCSLTVLNSSQKAKGESNPVLVKAWRSTVQRNREKGHIKQNLPISSCFLNEKTLFER